MEVIALNTMRGNATEAILTAADALQTGGVVLYPTDTLYGLGADAFSDDAVAKIYAIKGRREDKPMHCIVSDIDMAESYGEVGDLARQLVRELPRGKVTCVVKKKKGLDSGICRGISTFGFRIPDNEVCHALLRSFGSPITATSANKSDEEPEMSVEKILVQLGEGGLDIDVALDAGELSRAAPSTVVDLSRREPVIVREGAVPIADIWDVLRVGY